VLLAAALRALRSCGGISRSEYVEKRNLVTVDLVSEAKARSVRALLAVATMPPVASWPGARVMLDGRPTETSIHLPAAARHFRLGAELGDADAQMLLADLYRDGQRMPQNHAEAVVRWQGGQIRLRGEGAGLEQTRDLWDKCFALAVDGRVIVSGTTLVPHSARLLRFPVLQVLSWRSREESLEFELTLTFPASKSTISDQEWLGHLAELR
jgi:hypothetical protein